VPYGRSVADVPDVQRLVKRWGGRPALLAGGACARASTVGQVHAGAGDW